VSRMTKWMVGPVAAMVVAVGLLASLAGSAQAYDKGTCDQIFGVGNSAVDLANEDTGSSGKVDFGDVNHWFGVPLGTAVVCWGNNGKVAVKGRVFADSGDVLTFTSAKLTFFNNGVAGTELVAAEFWGNNGSDRIVSRISGAGFFNRVRIRLYSAGTLVDTINCNRAANLGDCD
jgi:hypothetical protein